MFFWQLRRQVSPSATGPLPKVPSLRFSARILTLGRCHCARAAVNSLLAAGAGSGTLPRANVAMSLFRASQPSPSPASKEAAMKTVPSKTVPSKAEPAALLAVADRPGHLRRTGLEPASGGRCSTARTSTAGMPSRGPTIVGRSRRAYCSAPQRGRLVVDSQGVWRLQLDLAVPLAAGRQQRRVHSSATRRRTASGGWRFRYWMTTIRCMPRSCRPNIAVACTVCRRPSRVPRRSLASGRRWPLSRRERRSRSRSTARWWSTRI